MQEGQQMVECDVKAIENKIAQIQDLSDNIKNSSFSLHCSAKEPELASEKPQHTEAGPRILDSLNAAIRTLERALEALRAFAG